MRSRRSRRWPTTSRRAAVLNNLGVVQLRRGGTPQTGLADLLLQQSGARPIPTIRTTSSTSATPTGSIAIRRRRSTGCARRCGATRPTAMRISSSAPRSRPAATRPRRRASASWRGACRRPTSRAKRPARRDGARRARARQERRRAAARQPHRRASGDDASSASRPSSRAFYLDRGRRLYQQENDREAVAELNHALYLSPYLADAHLLLGRIHLRNGRVHEAIDAFKIALWSAETAEAHAALGEAYRQAKDSTPARAEARARARARSGIGGRQSSCSHGSTHARAEPAENHVLKSQQLWRTRSRTRAFTRSS